MICAMINSLRLRADAQSKVILLLIAGLAIQVQCEALLRGKMFSIDNEYMCPLSDYNVVITYGGPHLNIKVKTTVFKEMMGTQINEYILGTDGTPMWNTPDIVYEFLDWKKGSNWECSMLNDDEFQHAVKARTNYLDEEVTLIFISNREDTKEIIEVFGVDFEKFLSKGLRSPMHIVRASDLWRVKTEDLIKTRMQRWTTGNMITHDSLDYTECEIDFAPKGSIYGPEATFIVRPIFGDSKNNIQFHHACTHNAKWYSTRSRRNSFEHETSHAVTLTVNRFVGKKKGATEKIYVNIDETTHAEMKNRWDQEVQVAKAEFSSNSADGASSLASHTTLVAVTVAGIVLCAVLYALCTAKTDATPQMELDHVLGEIV